MSGELPKITLVALEDVLASLGKANACDSMELVRAHIGRAVIAIDTALQYAEAAAFEVEARDKLLN